MSCCDPSNQNYKHEIKKAAAYANKSCECANESASSAATSAASAAASAASAASAAADAADAQEAWSEFQERYMGAYPAPPVATQVGALYWNSSSNALFVWNGTSWVAAPSGFNEFTTFLATGTTTARNLVTRMADLVNVKDFGAVGDGVNDDGPSIRSAIASALSVNNNKPIFFPFGKYRISTTTIGQTSLPTGSGYGVLCENNLSTPLDLIIFGENATIISNLYPQSSVNFNFFTFIAIFGNFDRVHCYNINFVSDQPIAQSPQTKGRTNGWTLGGTQNDVFSSTIMPQNVIFRDCSFRDLLIGIRPDNVESLLVDSCSFFYTYGYASVGGADWAVGIGSRQVGSNKITNCYFDGHTAPITPNITPYYSWKAKSADGLVLAAGGLPPFNLFKPASITFINNYVKNFHREGLQLLGNGPAEDDSSFEIGGVVANNIVDGTYKIGHEPSINWGLTNVNPNTVISNNVFHNCGVGVLLTGNLSINKVPYCNVSNNFILLPGADAPSQNTSVGIVVNGNWALIEGNTIIGKKIKPLAEGGWYGEVPKNNYAITSNNIVNNTITINNNPFYDGNRVTFISPPNGSGVTSSGVYFVVETVGNTFKIAESFGNNPPFNFATGVYNIVDITGNLAGVLMTVSSIDITTGIFVNGQNRNDNGTCIIKNNLFRIVNKIATNAYSAVISCGAGSFYALLQENVIDGFDFVTIKQGGDASNVLLNDNRIERNIRLNAGYISQFSGAPTIQKHSFNVYPIQVGWYKFPCTLRYSNSFELLIKTYGEKLYGDTTTPINNAGQYTRLKVSNYQGETSGLGNSDSSLSIEQNHIGSYPAVTKAYIRYFFQGIDFFVYINKVLTKAQLFFNGGGGTGAQGHANIVNGVVVSTTITNAGTGYTSAPQVDIIDPSNFFFDIRGSGATFSPVVAAGGVSSVNVLTGGSEYSQRIEFSFSDETFYGARTVVLDPEYQASAPTNGLEFNFQTGFKCITYGGSIGNPKIIGNGYPSTNAADLLVKPEYIGKQVINGNQIYIAAGTANASDWKLLN